MSATSYSVLSPPLSVTPLDESFEWRSDLIDYTRHPAYSRLVQEAGWFRRLRALTGYAGRFGVLLAKRVIRFEMIPAEFRKGRTLSHRLGFISRAAANMTRIGARRSAPTVRSDVGTELHDGGVAVVMMPDARRNELLRLAEPHFAALRARRGAGTAGRAFDESRATTDRASEPALFAVIEAIFSESGLSEAADQYLGRRAKLIDVNPQVNDPSDSFWRDVFDDLREQALPATAYCHRDSSGGDLKVIIYCSEVTETRGPFGYAIGSNKMRVSALDNILCEANDHNGLSSTALRARRRFAALPAKLRQKGSFGNDLPDSAPESRAIVDALWHITGPAGSMVAFDTKGVHRGGMVIEGERSVLTCVLG